MPEHAGGPPADGQTTRKLDFGAPVLTTPAVVVRRPNSPPSLIQDGVAWVPSWHPVQLAVRLAATFENATLEVIGTVLVIMEEGGMALLTVNVTSQLPTLVALTVAICPGEVTAHPEAPFKADAVSLHA
jgi:hypothetical protein